MKTSLMLLALWFCFKTVHHQAHRTASKTCPSQFPAEIPTAGYTVKSEKPSKGRLSVYDTNIDNDIDLVRILDGIESIYDIYSEQQERAEKFQYHLSNLYCSRAHVAINFYAVRYYQRFFIHLGIDGEDVLGWGI